MASRPNVLFIAVDDLKPLLGCYGETGIKTPNIDRLAKMGTVFLNNHCQQAVCGPTRSSLLTGQRPDFTQVWNNDGRIRRNNNLDILTLPQHFRQNGYTTTGLGKVFDTRTVDNKTDARSWSVPYDKLTDSDYAAGYSHTARAWRTPETAQMQEKILAKAKSMGLEGQERQAYLNQNRGPAVEAPDVPDDALPDGAMARKAVATIARLAKEKQPFFYAVGFFRPHLPFIAPKKYWNLYDRSQIKLAEYQQFASKSPEFAYQPSSELVTFYLQPNGERIPKDYAPISADIQRELIHGYYASVSYMDAQVGLLLDELDKQGLTENTVIMLWGDHGWHLGDHGIWCKHTNFEQSTRAPLIVAAPGFSGGQKATGITEFVDIFPTLAELAGLGTPDGLAGKSLVPLLKKPTAIVKRYAQSQFPRPGKAVTGGDLMGYAIRTDRYRYVAWFAEDFEKNKVLPTARPVAEELYDYKKDPNETMNFAAQADQQLVLREHQGYLKEFLSNQRHSR